MDGRGLYYNSNGLPPPAAPRDPDQFLGDR